MPRAAAINYCLLTNKVPGAGRALQGCSEALTALPGLMDALAIRSSEVKCALWGVWVGSGQLRHPQQCEKCKKLGLHLT